MNTEQMRNFAVAYRTHNFAAAARAIPMSAQGFTKSIKTLEGELGVPLFVRDEHTGQNMPTRYADEFNTYVIASEAHLRTMRKAFRRIDAEEKQRIVLGASLGIMGFLGNDFIKSFEAEHPDMSLQYLEMNDTQCDEFLADESVGIAFTLAPYAQGFETEELYSTPVCLWVNERNPLSSRETIEIADLDGQTLALPGREFKCHDGILNRCRQEGVEPEITLESSEMFWLYNFVHENNGLAFSAEHLGKLAFFTNGCVRCIPLRGVTWRFGISSLPRHRFSNAEKQFRKFCFTYFNKRFGTQHNADE